MRILRASLFFICFICLCPLSNGQSGNWLDRASNDYPGPFKYVRPMKLSYIMGWENKLNAGKMEVSITQPLPGVYQTNASGQSTGIARALFKYDFNGVGQTNAQTLKPINFRLVDYLKGKKTIFQTMFPPLQMIHDTTIVDTETGTKTPYRNISRFKKDVGLDLMSSALYLRSQALTKGQSISLVTSSFSNPYLVDFKVLGRETKTVSDKSYKTIKIAIQINEIDSTLAIQPYSKINQATVWISDDEYRVPVEFKGDIFIGSISVRLTDRDWIDK